MSQSDVTMLQNQLNDLIQIAKSNEQKQLNFQQYELSLLNSSGLESLLRLILKEHKQRFRLTEVTLLLLDLLTGVNSRRFFEQQISEEFSRAVRNTAPLACLFVDLDHFKRINDSYGHQTGDLVLKQIAQLLNDSLRQGDVLARYGSEEFVILLVDVNQQVAAEIAERMRRLVAETHFNALDGQAMHMTLSIGIATLNPGYATTIKRLLQSADQAVYEAKLSGRNQIRISTDS